MNEPRTRAILDLDTHPDPSVTVQDLAHYWKIATRTIYAAIDKGALPCTRIGGTIIRIRTEDARRFGNPKVQSASQPDESARAERI